MLLSHLDEKARARFHAKVDTSGGPDAYHPWTGAKSGKYGRFKVGGKSEGAHVVAWMIHHGKDVPDGYVVHHTCGMKLCCNPAHLQAVTQGENLAAPDGANGISEDFLALEAEWRRLHIDRYGYTALGDVKTFKLLLQRLGEHESRRILRAIVEDWDRFAAFAARAYGMWWGDADRAPECPTLAIFKGVSGTDAINAALAFAYQKTEESRMSDPAEQDRRLEHALRKSAAQAEAREAAKTAKTAKAEREKAEREKAARDRAERDEAEREQRRQKEERLPWLREMRAKRWAGLGLRRQEGEDPGSPH